MLRHIASLACAIHVLWAEKSNKREAAEKKPRTVHIPVNEFLDVTIAETVGDVTPDVRYSEDSTYATISQPRRTIEVTLTKEQFNDLANMMSSQANVQP